MHILLQQKQHKQQQQQDFNTVILHGILIQYDHIDITCNRLYKIYIKFCAMCGI